MCIMVQVVLRLQKVMHAVILKEVNITEKFIWSRASIKLEIRQPMDWWENHEFVDTTCTSNKSWILF